MEFFVPDSVKEIDWILNFPDKLEELFLQEISIYKKEKKMPYVTNAERIGEKRNLEIGEKKGVKIGEKKQIIINYCKCQKRRNPPVSG